MNYTDLFGNRIKIDLGDWPSVVTVMVGLVVVASALIFLH
jgi:hypothetical protein